MKKYILLSFVLINIIAALLLPVLVVLCSISIETGAPLVMLCTYAPHGKCVLPKRIHFSQDAEGYKDKRQSN